MKALLLIASALYVAESGAMLSDVEIRDKWAKGVAALTKGECAGEAEAVRAGIAKASALINHGEIEDGVAALQRAVAGVSDKCKTAIIKNSAPN